MKRLTAEEIAYRSYTTWTDDGYIVDKREWQRMSEQERRDTAWRNCEAEAGDCSPQMKGRVISEFLKLVGI